MCAEFMIRASAQKIQSALGRPIENDTGTEEWDRHVRLFGSAPVLINEKGRLHLKEMRFSLKPQGTPYPTFNARLSGWDDKRNKLIKIYERPTWKTPFEKRRCLIPMTGFIEPIYIGEMAGSALLFHKPSDEIMFVAGIYDETPDKKTGEIYEGFAPILHVPSDYILEHGHHRQIIELQPGPGQVWMMDESMNAEDRYRFLLEKRAFPDLRFSKHRDLAKNWERKVDDYKAKHEKELHFMKQMNEWV